MKYVDEFRNKNLVKSLVKKIELIIPAKNIYLMEVCGTRPDFIYDEHYTVIYVDGPHHQFPDRRARDVSQQTCLEDHGYTVVRFPEPEQWDAIFAAHPTAFGCGGAG